MKKYRIAIVGKGNVATHLYKAFEGTGNIVSIIDSRILEGLSTDFDIILIVVSDDVIEEVASNIWNLLPTYNGVVAHTAGSVALNVLEKFFPNHGVVYPMQTFSKDFKNLDYSKIPVFIEGRNDQTYNILYEIANSFSKYVYPLSTEDRIKLHIASVFACNFTNALFQAADEMIKEIHLPFSLFLPLIWQTVTKLEALTPSQAQTGPASRKDMKVIEHHLNILAERQDLKEIYKKLTEFIISKNNEQDRL